ncbi:MAG: SIMPL domain-containing protein, partial [Deltaproteobacteria bacterium]|nr:SIMPL domain-containing protein [Deltaproteobacteria bacterium]
MKRVLVPLLVVSLLFIAHTTFAQQCAKQCRSDCKSYLIHTEGTAEVTGHNDSARISVAVVTEGKNLDQVSSDNAARSKAVLGAIKGLNIQNLKLETSNYRVTP